MIKYLETNFDYYSEKFVEVFDELPLWAAPFGLKLLDNIQYRRSIAALDIGFGAGFPLTELAMRLGKDSQVYGIDPWDVAVDRAEKKLKVFGIQNVNIIRGFAEDIPLADSSVDLIVSNNGLNNVSDLDLAIQECSRLMNSGGQFIQTMNLNDSMVEFYSAMENVLRKLNLDNCLVDMKKQIYEKRKPLDEYLSLIKEHGFSIENVLHDKFEMRYSDGTAMLNHYFIRMAFMDGWKNIVPLDNQEQVFDLVEVKLNEEAKLNGCFKLTIPFVVIDCKKN